MPRRGRPDAPRAAAGRVRRVAAAFLPAIPTRRRAGWLAPAVVTDPRDPKLAHLDGLNLSRAWMLEGIAAGSAAGRPAPPGAAGRRRAPPRGRRCGPSPASTTRAATGWAASRCTSRRAGEWGNSASCDRAISRSGDLTVAAGFHFARSLLRKIPASQDPYFARSLLRRPTSQIPTSQDRKIGVSLSVSERRPKPALGLFDRHPLAPRVVLHLVAADPADAEVLAPSGG